MIKKWEYKSIYLYLEGILNSYSQIFFSKNKALAYLLLFSSFFHVYAGLSGLLAIIFTQFIAAFFGYNKLLIKDGTYTYNSLMVGMALGHFYAINLPYISLLLIASLFTFFLSIWMLSLLGKWNLPILSIPFLIAVWMIILSAQNFYVFKQLSDTTTSLFLLIGITSEFNLQLPDIILIYFKSLGAIFFQYNIVAGILISIGLFFFSRIAFLLSFLGFYAGFLFYSSFEGDVSELIYSYIGFNFILTSIALGGFFIVPSKKSFLLILLLIPLIALLISSLSTLFIGIKLPLYSLPFNIVVLLILVTLKYRVLDKGITLVTDQQFSPEKVHYKFFNSVSRFKNYTYLNVALPFLGEWRVSQGYSGEITHKEEWKEALDFDVIDDNNQTYRYPGLKAEEYYCFNLPVLAPANGYVVEVLDEVEDNEIGEVNLKNNWGNTVIIKHVEGLYSKLSHFKKGSIKIKVGDYVKKGEVLGLCGNSGRSPEPHIHFQMQSTPYIGSKTIFYPIGYYISKGKDVTSFKQFEIPEEDEIITNISTTELLIKSLNLIPGRTFNFFVIEQNSKKRDVKWEVFLNVYNKSYLYCHRTKSYAYFVNDGNVFYFTDFEGDRKSLLYNFYLLAYKVVLGHYEKLTINDYIQPYGLFKKHIQYLQDLVAPFFHFTSIGYDNTFTYVDNEHLPNEIHLDSKITKYFFGKRTKEITGKILFKDNEIYQIHFKGKNTIVACIKD